MPGNELFKNLQDRPWALHPAKFKEITAFIDRRLSGEKWDFPEATAGKGGNRAEDSYEVRDGVAILPVYGVIDKRMNMLMRISGGTSTELLARDFKKALADPKVQAILLDVDSPGGSVDGPKDLADLIYNARGQKPIVAYANGLMASAAYWIGSAADAVFANETAEVGSIGVAAVHYDYSAADEKAGIKRTSIYAGKYKRIASDERPLSEEGRDYLQSLIDDYYAIFLASVAQNRGTDVETVQKKMADGRIFIAKKALKAGLIDQIGNFNDALALARAKGGAMPKNMTRETLQAENPELFQAILAEGAASVTLESLLAKQPEAAEKLRIEGETRERARAVEILEAEGDQAVTLAAVKAGTPAAETFKQFFRAEREGRDKALENLKASAPEPMGQKPPAETKGDFMDKVAELQASGEAQTKGQAVRLAAERFPDLHEAYVQNQQTKKK